MKWLFFFCFFFDLFWAWCLGEDILSQIFRKHIFHHSFFWWFLGYQAYQLELASHELITTPRRFGSRFLKQRTQNRMHWGWSIQPDSARGETDPGEEEKLQQKHPQKHGQKWQNQSKKQGKTRKTPLFLFFEDANWRSTDFFFYHGSQKMLEFGRVGGLEISWFGTYFLLTRGLKRCTSTLSLASTILWGPFHQPSPVSGFWVQDIHS